MFARDARKYIEKLIHIQNVIEKKGYRRIDQAAVRKSKEHLSKYLHYYRLESDDQMKGFFVRNADHIRVIIPGPKYPGYQKLIDEFSNLKNQ